MLGAVIALAALVGFWLVRQEAVRAAEQEARDEVRKVAPTEIGAYFRCADGTAVLKAVFENNPGLMVAAVRAVDSDLGMGVKESDADRIAEAMGEPSDVGPGTN